MDVCVFLETDLATAKNRKTTNYLKEFLTGREACLGMNGQLSNHYFQSLKLENSLQKLENWRVEKMENIKNYKQLK